MESQTVSVLISVLIATVQCSVSPEEVNFFYFSADTNNTQLYADDNLEFVDLSLPIAFIIHGWEDDSNDTWVEDLTDLYVKKGEYNVITVDWAGPADDPFYATSVEDVRAVGGYVGNLIVNLFGKYSASLDNFHLIGHSLGAHVAGFAGKTVQNYTNSSIGRITGLDPAGPLYLFAGPADRLANTDAELVVVLHTDGGVLGYLGEIGNIDFYANLGMPHQPGCFDFLTTSCSHSRAHKYFVESVINPQGFVSTECGAYLLYMLGFCSSNRVVTLGGNLTTGDAGKYFFTTNPEYPFSKE